MTENQQTILNLLSSERKHVDTISEESGLSTNDTVITLTLLELKGVATRMPGNTFVKTDKGE